MIHLFLKPLSDLPIPHPNTTVVNASIPNHTVTFNGANDADTYQSNADADAYICTIHERLSNAADASMQSRMSFVLAVSDTNWEKTFEEFYEYS